MTGSGPTVTVLIPARDEAESIAGCIEAVGAQDYPLELIELVLVDGSSRDDTVAIAQERFDQFAFARTVVVPNPAGSTPVGLDLGLAEATGAILCRVDARSIVPPSYVRTCVEVLFERSDVAVVGGRQVAVARSLRPRELGIARALNNRWGMGLSRYRRGAASGPADTVYLGSFRTWQLREEGGWDPAFATNQDFELNRRMARRGQVWFDARLEVGYLPRARLAELFAQYRRFGRWKVTYWFATGDRPRPRQLALAIGPLVAAVAAAGMWRSGGRRRGAMVVATVVAAVGFETRGPTGPESGPLGHAVGVAASAAVAGGWLCGLWGELLGRVRRARAGAAST